MRRAQAGFKAGKDGKSAADWLAEVGPTFRVDVGRKSLTPGYPPSLPMKQVHALIDTGAGGNCVDEDLAVRLGLSIVEQGVTSGVHGPEQTNFYGARVYIPDLDRLIFEPFAGAKLERGGQPHRVIFGRALLRRYHLLYDGISGAVELVEP